MTTQTSNDNPNPSLDELNTAEANANAQGQIERIALATSWFFNILNENLENGGRVAYTLTRDFMQLIVGMMYNADDEGRDDGDDPSDALVASYSAGYRDGFVAGQIRTPPQEQTP